MWFAWSPYNGQGPLVNRGEGTALALLFSRRRPHTRYLGERGKATSRDVLEEGVLRCWMRKGDLSQGIGELVCGGFLRLKQRMLEGRRVIIRQVEREHTGLQSVVVALRS